MLDVFGVFKMWWFKGSKGMVKWKRFVICD